MTLSSASATVPDLLRLVALPVFAWIAILDVKTRRVPSDVWIPLSALGAVLLVWDGWRASQAGGTDWTLEFLVPAAISLGLVMPAAYLFWWLGGMGGADAKAVLALSLLFPAPATFSLGIVALPLAGNPELIPFSATIIVNAALIAMVFPVLLGLRNAVAGRFAPVMIVGWPVSVERISRTHGLLLERPDGVGFGGLDLDALRMYLRWRGIDLEDIRADPDHYRDPASLPAEPNPPTDGRIESPSLLADGGTPRADDDDRGPTDQARLTNEDGPVGDEKPSDETPAGDDETPVGDDETPVGDDETPAGDDETPTGDDETPVGDDETPVGDDETPAGDDETPSEDGDRSDEQEYDDPWGAAAFLDDIEGSAYGTSPEALRTGLEVLARKERVWVSPGTPLLLPVFVGLILSVLIGNLLTPIMG